MGIEEFIHDALRGRPTECLINISQFQDLYKALGEGLKSQGIPTSEIVDMRWLNLKAVCPDCNSFIMGNELGNLYMIGVDSERFGWDKIIIRGPGRAIRFCREGLCLNESCSSTEIALFWRPYYDLFKEKKDVKGLIKVLGTEIDWFARKKAAEALGNIGDKRAVEPLVQALKDEYADVRKAAKKSLEKIKKKV